MLTQEVFNHLVKPYQVNYTEFLNSGVCTIKEGEYYFHTKDDPFAEHPKSLEQVLYYIIEDTVARICNKKHHSKMLKMNNVIRALRLGE